VFCSVAKGLPGDGDNTFQLMTFTKQ